MKLLTKISLLAGFLFLTSVVFATGGEEKKSETKTQIPEQQGEKKPDDKEIDLPESTDVSEEPETEQVVDSTQESSSRKYNFIFYFLYKMKYNEDQEDVMF